MVSATRALLHLLVAAHFWFGCYYDWNYVKIPANVHRIGQSFGNTKKLKFLTYWDALIQALFFTVCFLNDIVGTTEAAPKRAPLIRKIQDVLLASLAFPLSMFVGLTFWALYAIDRELVFPAAIDPYFPGWLNHVMHTNIMIFVLLEVFMSFRRYPSRKVGLGILTAFILSYLVWVHVIHAYSGMWVYPVLDVLSFYGRVSFFAGLYGLVISLYIVGENLNGRIWLNKVQFTAKDD